MDEDPAVPGARGVRRGPGARSSGPAGDTRVLVVKVGGAALGAQGGGEPALADAAALARRGLRVAVVHGGGPEISAWSQRVGIRPRFVRGLRQTDADTAAVAEMVLAGRVGKAVAAALSSLGSPAVSLCGKDADLFRAEPVGDPALGYVGRVGAVRAEVLAALWECGFVPVLAPVALGPDGATYNINADDCAADLAVALGASALVLATDVPGVLLPGDGGLLDRCDAATARRLIADGTVSGGMRPKVEACLRAVAGGVQAAWIVDGGRPGAVREAADGAAGAGTVFLGEGQRRAAGG